MGGIAREETLLEVRVGGLPPWSDQITHKAHCIMILVS